MPVIGLIAVAFLGGLAYDLYKKHVAAQGTPNASGQIPPLTLSMANGAIAAGVNQIVNLTPPAGTAWTSAPVTDNQGVLASTGGAGTFVGIKAGTANVSATVADASGNPQALKTTINIMA